jgi:hypothetical protein
MNPESNFADEFLEAVRRRCGDVSCGTLWWAEESLWIEKLPHTYRPKSPGHPGLSLWRATRRESLGAAPMLYGSRQRGENVAVVAADLSPNYPPGTLTHFGGFGPVDMESREFAGESAPATPAQNRDFDLDAWFSRPRIRKNHYKKRLDANEFADLTGWMQQKGLWA